MHMVCTLYVIDTWFATACLVLPNLAKLTVEIHLVQFNVRSIHWNKTSHRRKFGGPQLHFQICCERSRHCSSTQRLNTESSIDCCMFCITQSEGFFIFAHKQTYSNRFNSQQCMYAISNSWLHVCYDFYIYDCKEFIANILVTHLYSSSRSLACDSRWIRQKENHFP